MVDIRTVSDERIEHSTITDILNAESLQTGLPYQPVPLNLEVYDHGQIAGGLAGYTNWDWLYIERLAVASNLRGLGVGRQLVEEAERIAIDRDCIGAWVDTFTFQAPQFYEQIGYSEFGRLPHYPDGHSRIFLRKLFQAT